MLRLLTIAVLVLPACYGARTRPIDGDAAARPDAASMPDTSVRVDGGVAPRDVGRDTPILLPDIGPICRDGTPSDYTGGRCSDETARCARACGGDEVCVDECIRADATCVECLVGEVIECAVPRAGCQAEWDAFSCCRVSRCAGLDVIECVESFCDGDFVPLETCVGSAGRGCAEAQRACFE